MSIEPFTLRSCLLLVGTTSMSAKSKRKQKSLWAIELLPHSFEKTVDIPFQTCVDRLRDLEEPWRSRWGHPSYKAQAQRTYYDFYNFEILIRYYSFRYPYQESGIIRQRCVGTVLHDKPSGKTIVRGRFTLVLFTPMFLVIAILLTLMLLAVHFN